MQDKRYLDVDLTVNGDIKAIAYGDSLFDKPYGYSFNPLIASAAGHDLHHLERAKLTVRGNIIAENRGNVGMETHAMGLGDWDYINGIPAGKLETNPLTIKDVQLTVGGDILAKSTAPAYENGVKTVDTLACAGFFNHMNSGLRNHDTFTGNHIQVKGDVIADGQTKRSIATLWGYFIGNENQFSAHALKAHNETGPVVAAPFYHFVDGTKNAVSLSEGVSANGTGGTAAGFATKVTQFDGAVNTIDVKAIRASGVEDLSGFAVSTQTHKNQPALRINVKNTDLVLDEITLDGAQKATGIGGFLSSNSGQVENCSVTCRTISSTASDNQYVGGFVSYNNKGTILDCQAYLEEISVAGFGHIGGFAGYNTGEIERSFSNVDTISVHGDPQNVTKGNQSVGGFLGYGYGGSIRNASAFIRDSITVDNGNYVNMGGFAGTVFDEVHRNNAAQIGEDIHAVNSAGVVNIGGYTGQLRAFKGNVLAERSTALVFGNLEGTSSASNNLNLIGGFSGVLQGRNGDPTTAVIRDSAAFTGDELKMTSPTPNGEAAALGALHNGTLSGFTVIGIPAKDGSAKQAVQARYVGGFGQPAEFRDNYFVKVKGTNRIAVPVTYSQDAGFQQGVETGKVEIAFQERQMDCWGKDAAKEKAPIPYLNFDYVIQKADNIVLQAIANGSEKISTGTFATASLPEFNMRHLALWSGSDGMSGPIYDILGISDAAEQTATVTFRVVNGTWADETTADKQVTVPLSSGKGTLPVNRIPTGMKADAGFMGGDWEALPDPAPGAVTGDIVYTYTFQRDLPAVIEVTPKDPDQPFHPENQDDGNNSQKTPQGFVRVIFESGEHGTFGTYAGGQDKVKVAYDVKAGQTWEKVAVPAVTAKPGYTAKSGIERWNPQLPGAAETVTGGTYTAQYTKNTGGKVLWYQEIYLQNPDGTFSSWRYGHGGFAQPNTTVRINLTAFDGQKTAWGDTLGVEFVFDADHVQNRLSDMAENAGKQTPLRAYYKRAPHTVTYQYEGTVPDGAPTVPAKVDSWYGANVPIAEVPTLAGYVFSGWTTDTAGAVVNKGILTMPNADVVLKGTWTKGAPKVFFPTMGIMIEGNRIDVPAEGPDGSNANLSEMFRPITATLGTVERSFTSNTVGAAGFPLTLRFADPPASQFSEGDYPLTVGNLPEGYTYELLVNGKVVQSPIRVDKNLSNIMLNIRKTYTLTYDTNGGNADGPAAQSGLLPDTYPLSATKPTHASVDGKAVVWIGWTAEQDPAIYERETASFDPSHLLTAVTISNQDETVYALWGYDENGNGTADVLEETATITFRIMNGTWADGSTADKQTLILLHEGKGTLDAASIPTGMKANSGYTGGTWDRQPDTTADAVTGSLLYTYSFRRDGGHGGNGGHGGSTRYTLTYVSNGGTEYKAERYDSGTTVKLNKTPVREGYLFTGWYADRKLTDEISRIKMTGNKTVYAGWEKNAPALHIPDMLNGDDHFAYVSGYPDGTVRPNAEITRAEVAMIFYRLLDEDVRAANESNHSTFSDVTDGMWFHTAVSTIARLGIVKGRSAGIFDPNAPITRGEFATVCARFDHSKAEHAESFSDIHGHWAETFIAHAAALGWVNGYLDGTFRPNATITRAEAMAMINRVLGRLPESEKDLLPGMKTWPDNSNSNTWYYLTVQEATNGHIFERKADGIHERWINLKESQRLHG